MSKRAKIKTKKSEIAEYWAEKYITESGTVLTYDDFVKSGEKGVNVVYDTTDLPSCFICGRGKPVLRKEDFEDTFDIWDKAFYLERAHIIPDSIGGIDAPSNLMCLCSRCHKNAPNTRDYAGFMRYVYEEISSEKWFLGFEVEPAKQIAKYAMDLGLAYEDVVDIPMDKFKQYERTFPYIAHFGESVNDSTLFLFMRHVVEEIAKEKFMSLEKI